MNILADVAAGGDRDKLRKMMEQGQVDVYKYLPLVFEEMRKRAQIGLKEYYEGILYQQRRVGRANEAFLRSFMSGGASEGMKRIYTVFAQTVEDSLPMAEKLGDVFGELFWRISQFSLLPSELSRWTKGEEDVRNFWQKYFGSFNTFESRWNIFWDGSAEKFNVLGKSLAKAVEPIQSIYSATLPGQVESYYRTQAQRQAEEEARKAGGASQQEINRRAAEIYEAGRVIRGKRISSGETSQQLAAEALNKHLKERGTGNRASDFIYSTILPGATKMLADMFGIDLGPSLLVQGGIGDFSLNKVLHEKQKQVNSENAFRRAVGLPLIPVPSNSIMFAGEDNRSFAHRDGVFPAYSQGLDLPKVSPFSPLMSGVEDSVLMGVGLQDISKTISDRVSADLFRRIVEGLQSVPEYGPSVTSYSNQITPEVRIIISGGITVDGELGTMIDDTNLSEKFNEQIEQMLYGARPQFSIVHR